MKYNFRQTTIRPDAHDMLEDLRKMLSAEKGTLVNLTDAVSVAVREAVNRRKPWPTSISDYEPPASP